MKNIFSSNIVALLISVGCFLISPVVLAVSFSVDYGAVGLGGSDVAVDSAAGDVQLQNNIYQGGTVNTVGTNNRIINGGGAANGVNGLLLQPSDNVNALSKGNDPTSGLWDITFSVDGTSVGKAGSAVNGEAANNSAAGQIFWANNMAGVLGNNFTAAWADEQQHGLDVNPEDNLDAMDIWDGGDESMPVDLTNETFYLSLDGSADILKAPGGGGVVFNAYTAAQLGLVSGQDDIDALTLNTAENIAIFSLAPGSVSLLGADGVVGGGDDRSAADLFITDLTVLGKELLFGYDDLGLLFGDNIDALDISTIAPRQPGASPVPVPAAFWLFSSGILGLLGIARRRACKFFIL